MTQRVYNNEAVSSEGTIRVGDACLAVDGGGNGLAMGCVWVGAWDGTCGGAHGNLTGSAPDYVCILAGSTIVVSSIGT